MISLQPYHIGQRVAIHDETNDLDWSKAFLARVIAWDCDSITVRDDEGNESQCEPSHVSSVDDSVYNVLD